jgi:aminocarboxymuconate-semialdehyde decarboxylase
MTNVRIRTVDIHAHYQSAAAEALMRPYFRPEMMPLLRFSSPATGAVNARNLPIAAARASGTTERLADMEARGVDMQVLSPTPGQYSYWAEPELGRDASRIINDEIAALVAGEPDRFAGLGNVPLQDARLAVDELHRCVRELGLRGVEIDSNVRGAELSSAALRPFWRAAEELGVLVFLHPLGFTHGERLSEHYLANTMGNPIESSIAVAHLIYDGVLDAHPGLKICVGHGGGYLPYYPGRMKHAFSAREDCRSCEHSPETYLARLFYDTVVYDEEQLAYLVRRYGSDHVLMGTDWPYDMGEPDPVGLIERAPGLDEAARSNVLGANALRLLGSTPH